jgi:hypothetical protein
MFEGPGQTYVCTRSSIKMSMQQPQKNFLAKDNTQKYSVQRMACLLFSHFVEKRTSIKVFSWQIHTAKILL